LNEERESALVEKLCKSNKRVDASEWEALFRRHQARGLSEEQIAEVVGECFARGEIWPSKYEVDLEKCSVKRFDFADWCSTKISPKSDCPRCDGKGWYYRDYDPDKGIDRTEYVTCNCAYEEDEAVAS
jgi:hypothetical protein